MKLHEVWQQQLLRLYTLGSPIGPRGFQTRELLNQTLRVTARYNMLDVPERRLNFRFAVAEWLWMTFGCSDLESIAQYNSVMRQFSDDGVFLTGAYGPHLRARREVCLAKLKADPATRQAVMQIPRPLHYTKDEPCTLSLQLLNRDGALHMTSTMRSSDIWLGVPYDVFSFTQLLNCFAGTLGLKVGMLTLQAASSHLYERDVPAVEPVTTGWGNTLRSPALPGFPPAWLEDVLRTRRSDFDPSDEPWSSYARVLCSRTSADARAILEALHHKAQGETTVKA